MVHEPPLGQENIFMRHSIATAIKSVIEFNNITVAFKTLKHFSLGAVCIELNWMQMLVKSHHNVEFITELRKRSWLFG